MIYFVLGVSIVMLALLYNHFMYKDAMNTVDKLKDYLQKNCENSITPSLNLYNELSKEQRLFLDKFSKYMECNKLLYQLHLKMHDIFCLDIKKIEQTNRLDKLTYKYEDYYCANDVYEILYFIDNLYEKYLKSNKNLNYKAFNVQLFGKEIIDDNELLNYILKMTLKEFVITFSVLR